MISFRVRDFGNGVLRVHRTHLSPGEIQLGVPGQLEGGVPVDFSCPELLDALHVALAETPIPIITPFVGRAVPDGEGGLVLRATPGPSYLIPGSDLPVDGLSHGVRARVVVDPPR